MLEAQGAAMATPLAEVVEVATPVLGEEELTLGGAVVVTMIVTKKVTMFILLDLATKKTIFRLTDLYL